MQRSKLYELARFQKEVLEEATQQLWSGLSKEALKEEVEGLLSVYVDASEWTHESETEFHADYRRSTGHASYFRRRSGRELRVIVDFFGSSVTVVAPSRELILHVFEVFEKHLKSSLRPPPPPPEPPKPRIFIGHGRSLAWRDLKDHLHEQHGFDVEAYEIGARAGHAVRDILQEMLNKSSFALLVMTGEDEAEGELRARQNVVHEAGLFQGRLGFARAIVLLEDGTTHFSNIDGIERIRFSPGNIREAFGDVVATIRREFRRR